MDNINTNESAASTHVIEIGATYIRIGIAHQPKISPATFRTPKSYDEILRLIATEGNDLGVVPTDAADTVFVASPGMIDRDGSVVTALYAPLSGRRIGSDIASVTGLKVRVMNDAAAQACGALVGTQGSNLYVSIGSAIGGAIVSQGALFEGTNGFAGEIGHFAVAQGSAQCRCGRKGCLDTLLSGIILVEKFGERWWFGTPSSRLAEHLAIATSAFAELIASMANLLDLNRSWSTEK